MSELKGQLLAMILTLAAFGTIAAILIPTFQKSAKEVDREITITDSNSISNVKGSSANMFEI
ncbi:MAG: hypothetical protein MR990_02175 [Mollicutes bacterium]|nr:hypothetical protein [Mollicutes bacterium]MDD7043270.1 hypothetical protein [Mollicutes bacterium]MDY6070636.1 hypothetical protein [Bacilli bacterium]